MADHDSTPIVCSCCTLGVHYEFVVLSAPAVAPEPLARFAQRLSPKEQARILAKLRDARERPHDH